MIPPISDWLWPVCKGIAERKFAGSNPPDDKGNFCDPAHIRSVAATFETSKTDATPNPPGVTIGLQREVQKGIWDHVQE